MTSFESEQICAETLRRLLLVLHPPADQPACDQVLRAVSRSLIELEAQLPNPNALLRELIDEFRPLAGPMVNESPVLWRRLSSYPTWRLLLNLNEQTPRQVLAAIGAEIAMAFDLNKAISDSRANALRILVRGARGIEDGMLRQALFNAELRFSGGQTGGVATQRDAFQAYYRSRFHFAGEHAQQARSSHRTLDAGFFARAMAALRLRVEAGDRVAALQSMCLCSGFGLELTRMLPLLGRIVDDWVATLDLDAGLILLDLTVVAPGVRKRPSGSSIPATRILARPLPAFLHRALRERHGEHPDARMLDELLEHPETIERDSIDDHPHPQRLRPSLARAQNTVEGYLVRELGIDRVTAAHLSARFESVTHAKPHYALISREALWQATETWFETIGWGAPVPFAEGLPSGPLGVPTDEAVCEWFAALRHRVQISAPGRNAGAPRLLAHHNDFSRAAASIVALCLALRPVKALPILADVEVGGLTISVLDKRSPSAWAPDGRSAGPHPVPLARLARYQVEMYREHCVALARRLRRFDELAAARAGLEQIHRGAAVPLFVLIGDNGELQRVGTRQLTEWWPEHLQLSNNWWRSFWQTRLAELGVPSRAIDRLMRHVTAGERPFSSDGGDSPLDAVRAVTDAMNRELARLGIEPLRGL